MGRHRDCFPSFPATVTALGRTSSAKCSTALECLYLPIYFLGLPLKGTIQEKEAWWISTYKGDHYQLFLCAPVCVRVHVGGRGQCGVTPQPLLHLIFEAESLTKPGATIWLVGQQLPGSDRTVCISSPGTTVCGCNWLSTWGSEHRASCLCGEHFTN